MEDTASDFLVEKGYLPEMGARPMRRKIEQYLEDPLSEKLLQNPNIEKKYLISVKDNNIVFIDQNPDASKPKEEALAKK